MSPFLIIDNTKHMIPC